MSLNNNFRIIKLAKITESNQKIIINNNNSNNNNKFKKIKIIKFLDY